METEKIKLHNGTWEIFITYIKGNYKFYHCQTEASALSLSMTLTELGNICSVGKNSQGWYVKINNN